ncbi:MAG: hypothetical protein WBB27_09985 [Maribacter sp.]
MKNSLALVLLLSITSAMAQLDNNVEDHQLQVSLPMPGILYEKGIGNNTTLSIEAITGFSLRGCTGCETDFGVYPIVRGQYRYYYNMNRRLDKGKSITGNSGNYLGGLLLFQEGNAIVGNLNTSTVVAVGPVYGLQRTYKRGFFYRLETGVAFFEDNFNNGITLVLAARVGWVIRKRR